MLDFVGTGLHIHRHSLRGMSSWPQLADNTVGGQHFWHVAAGRLNQRLPADLLR